MMLFEYVLVVSFIVGFNKGQAQNDVLFTSAPVETTRRQSTQATPAASGGGPPRPTPFPENELFTSAPLPVESNEIPNAVALLTNSTLSNSTEVPSQTNAPPRFETPSTTTTWSNPGEVPLQTNVPARFETTTTTTTTSAPIVFENPSPSTTSAPIHYEPPSTTTTTESPPIYFENPSSTTDDAPIFPENPTTPDDAPIHHETPSTTAFIPIIFETPNITTVETQVHFESPTTEAPFYHPPSTQSTTKNIPVYSQTPSYPHDPIYHHPPNQDQSLVQLAINKILPSQKTCGFQNERVSTFEDSSLANMDEFPWLALLRYRYTFGFDAGFRCAGTLISQQYVLTAANCVLTQKKLLDLQCVRLGEWRISSKYDCVTNNNREECTKQFLEVGVARTLVHPNHNCIYGNDNIALLRLNRKVHFSDTVRPICLPNANLKAPKSGTLLVTAGWGATEWGHILDIKTKTDLPILTDMECSTRLKPNMYIFQNEVCVGTNFFSTRCGPDYGAPVMNADRSKRPQWYLEGVISGGYGFGKNGVPELYTRVPNYVQWILTNVAEDTLNAV